MNNWIFIRGLLRGNVHWGQFTELLANKAPHINAEYLEIPGNGLLTHLKTPTNPLEVVDALRKQSQFIKKKEPFNLCGISLGGMIVLKWAELFPDEVQSAWIINSSLQQLSPFYHRLRPNGLKMISRGFLPKSNRELEIEILKITTNNPKLLKQYSKKFSQFAESHPIQKLNFFRQILLASNIKINFPLKVPVNLIYSTNDHLVNHRCSIEIAKKLAIKPLVHPTAGHDLPLEDPEWFIEQIKKTY